MRYTVSCTDLGIHNCDWTATGETAGDVVEDVVRHVRKEQKINLPDAQTIMEGDFWQNPLDDTMDPAVVTIVQRLRERLNLQDADTGTDVDDIDIVAGRVKSP
jgi:predicted small metal-binding protein